ncbi:NAD-dependent epimerase/dehydratase family protein [Candidatus Nomurabacteria bacterium]|nr:NAD-dependent epimerase/dehydratase family protein [Candidatus Nomurabacteria bacterium]
MIIKKFLITGGAGFIGTNLTNFLVECGQEVVVVDDLSAGDQIRLPKEVIFHKIDVRDQHLLEKATEGVDVIVHLAALPKVQYSIDCPTESHDVNVNGTLSVLEAAKTAGVKRVVFAASSAAYGDQETLPLSTDLPVDPKSPYALQKFMGEGLMKLWSNLYNVETVSLRFFNVYGPYFDPNGPYALVIGRFLNLKESGEPLTITGDGEQTRDFIHVHDVVNAIFKSSVNPNVGHGEVFNIGSGKQTSVNNLAKMIGGEIEYVAPRHEPRHTLADISKTIEQLEWEPEISLEAGIAELL